MPAENQTKGPESGGQPPADFWRILRRRKGALVLFGAAGTLAGVLCMLPQTPLYQARTSLEIVGLNENFLNTKQVRPLAEPGAVSDAADLQTQIRILLSDSLLRRVLDKLRPGALPALGAPGLFAAWRRLFHIDDTAPAGSRAAALLEAQSGIRVRSAGSSRILEISADSPDPGRAADLANTLAGEFIAQNLEARSKATRDTNRLLNGQLEEMRRKLEQAEQRLQAYAKQSGLMFTSDDVSVAQDELGRMKEALSIAETDRITRQSRYEMALASPPETLPDVLNDQSLRDYRARRADLRRQLADLDPTYTPEHPKVIRAQAQLAATESALERERADILKRIENEYQEARRKALLLANAYHEQARLAAKESEAIIRYNILKREADSARQLYDTLLQQMKQSDIAAATRSGNIRVIDEARVPASPYKPDRLLGAAAGLLIGLMAGVVVLVMRDRGDRSIRQPGDASFFLNLPELGVIPSGNGHAARRLARLLPFNGAGRQAGGIELVTWLKKPSLISESFRSTLLSILFANGGRQAQTLVIASGEPSEGKSTVASNLALALAETGKKVLLIDADLRRPKLHEIFGLSNEHGLSDILSGAPLNGAGSPLGLIRATRAPGVFLLTSGPDAAPAPLFHGPRMPDLLRRLRKDYAAILIDTPPMLQLPDARLLGSMADQVILVARCGRTSRDSLLAVRRRFSEDGASVLGTVLNDWDPASAPYAPNGHLQGAYKSFRKHYASRGAHA
ncbi:MAG TPA: polysaccharide biosynthesis tyrosine autokinase [Bryobacteraceae bacterium]|nr:polysaccharide biosynthesis tyrosine autokinase [Bryobacteraceae bacterium]